MILEGARQVGKTWLLKEFGGKEYNNMVYVNCHDHPETHQFFQQDLFLVQHGERVIPVEVKAEENVKSKSLAQFVKVDFAEEHLKGLRISMKPYADQGWMENIPLYAAEGYLNSEKTIE